MESFIFEVCIDSTASALAAQGGGAQRVELCDNLIEGGTTPSIGMVKAVCSRLRIPVHVLLRPRGGDFCYSEDEMEVMELDIDAIKAAGAAGVVLGVLSPNGSVDMDRTRRLVTRARPMSVTFHRAIDVAADASAALAACVREEAWEEAVRLYEQQLKTDAAPPDGTTLALAARAVAAQGEWERGCKLLAASRAAGWASTWR